MASDDRSAPALPTGVVVPPPAQVRPGHDDLPAGALGACAVDALGAVTSSARAVGDLVAAPVTAGAPVLDRADEVGADHGRGTPLQAMVGWGAALALGSACWAGVLTLVARFS